MEFPKKVAKTVMREIGDAGNPNDFVMRIPVLEFSDDEYDKKIWEEGAYGLFFDLLVKGKISEDDFRSIRVYDITECGGNRTKTPHKYQDFRDATIYLPKRQES